MHMAAFSCQNQATFAHDFAYLTNVAPFDLPPPSIQQQAGVLASTSSYFPCYNDPFDAINDVLPSEISMFNAGTVPISVDDTTSPSPERSISLQSGMTLPSVDNKVSSSSSSSAQQSAGESKTQCFPQKRRRERQRCNSSSARPTDDKRRKSSRLKKCSGATKEAPEPQEPPTGYVHVRERRGEATDIHSLAERVRREKIKVRMRLLQDLVPSCDKGVGKAVLLDEIINYIQSLQSQVQFLSMKLAAIDAKLDDFALESNGYVILPENLENVSPALPGVGRTSHILPTASADAPNNYPVHDSVGPIFAAWEGSQLHGGELDQPFVTERDCEFLSNPC